MAPLLVDTLSEAKRKDIVWSLNDLLSSEYDILRAYGVVAGHLDNPDWQARIHAFKEEHEGHAEALATLTRRLHGHPVERRHVMGPVRAVIARLSAASGDRAVLATFRGGQRFLRRKYARHLREMEHEGVPDEVVDVVRRNLEAVRRHKEWVIERTEEA